MNLSYISTESYSLLFLIPMIAKAVEVAAMKQTVSDATLRQFVWHSARINIILVACNKSILLKNEKIKFHILLEKIKKKQFFSGLANEYFLLKDWFF